MRIVGDRVFPLERHEAEALARVDTSAPARIAKSVAGAERASDDPLERRRVVAHGPHGTPITINPIDHLRRLPVYEAWARQRGWPVRAVWLVLHEVNDGLRGATSITRIREGAPEYTIWLNVARMRCVLHRLSTVAHEGEHISRGDCLSAAGYSREQEDPCDAAGRREVRAALNVVRSARSAQTVVDEARCATCCEHAEAPCPQGAAVFEGINRALGPL